MQALDREHQEGSTRWNGYPRRKWRSRTDRVLVGFLAAEKLTGPRKRLPVGAGRLNAFIA